MASPALQALIDASAGAAGSLFTCYLLYPLDLAKTQIQSGATKDVRSTLLQILREHGVLGLFEGLGPRALQTVLQNFIYFYAYAWLKQRHQQLGHQPTAVANTALGVLAGIANLTVTLPLETVVVQLQTQPQGADERRSAAQLAAQLWRTGLWKSYWISCALTLNPALTTALFDALKARYLTLLSAQGSGRRRQHSLSTAQAFAIGSLAKAAATLATYPLVRLKITQQAQAAQGTAVTLSQIARQIVKAEGAAGLYRGCSAQIGTSVLKSGVLLASKEQLVRYTMSLILMASRRNKSSKQAVA